MLAYVLYLAAISVPLFPLLLNGRKAWDFSTRWKRARATTLWSKDADGERPFDAPSSLPRRRRLSGGDRARWIRFRIAYIDAHGRGHEAEVERPVLHGRQPPASMAIRYDTRAPGRVDVFGAMIATTNIVIWGVVLAAVLATLSADRIAAIVG